MSEQRSTEQRDYVPTAGAGRNGTTLRTIEVVKIADYWRVLINRKLVSSHRTKADAMKSLPKVKKP